MAGKNGCNCPENLIMLHPIQHDILDGRTRDPDVEKFKIESKEFLDTYPHNYRHRIAFALTYRYEFWQAMIHHENRMQGRTKCLKP
jgi:hypothetical protein